MCSTVGEQCALLSEPSGRRVWVRARAIHWCEPTRSHHIRAVERRDSTNADCFCSALFRSVPFLYLFRFGSVRFGSDSDGNIGIGKQSVSQTKRVTAGRRLGRDATRRDAMADRVVWERRVRVERGDGHQRSRDGRRRGTAGHGAARGPPLCLDEAARAYCQPAEPNVPLKPLHFLCRSALVTRPKRSARCRSASGCSLNATNCSERSGTRNCKGEARHGAEREERPPAEQRPLRECASATDRHGTSHRVETHLPLSSIKPRRAPLRIH